MNAAAPCAGLIGFWPFTNTPMLWWGVAALIPILLHFWSRRRYQEIPWAAMEYLLAAVRNRARRLRIEHLILLLVRISILLLLAFALANPIVTGRSSGSGTRASITATHTVIVLDGSYSMDYRLQDRTCFEQAKKLASDLVAAGRQGDAFTLICMAQPPRVVIGQAAFDPDDVVREIDQLQRTDEGADLVATCALVENVLNRVRRHYPRLAKHRVCFYTDLGRNTWAAAATDTGRAALGRLGDLAELELVDVGKDIETNLAVVDVTADPAVATVARPMQVTVHLEHFGTGNRESVRVAVLVDGQQAAMRRVTVPAGGQASVAIQHQFLLSGEHVIEARLDTDRLQADNSRWLSCLVRPALRVLCVEGKPGAAANVALALEPVKSRTPRIIPVVRSEDALVDEDLRRYDAVFICNVGRFGRRQAGLLRSYVQRGGGVVWFLGDQVDCENYNRVLVGDDPSRALLPVRLVGKAGRGEYRFDPQEYRNALVAPFRGNERAGLLTTPVWEYIRAVPIPETPVDVALAFQNGDPAIVQRTLGRGCVILVTTAASKQSVDGTGPDSAEWTALPIWPSFLPLVQEMLKQTLSGAVANRNLLVGDPIEAVLSPDTSSSWVTVSDPAGQKQRVALHSRAGDPECDYSGTFRAGIYTLQSEDPPANALRYAVNLDTRESSVDRFDASQLPSEFHRQSGGKLQPTVDSAEKPAARSVLYRYLLAMVLVLLLLETFLAWFFGKEAFGKGLGSERAVHY